MKLKIAVAGLLLGFSVACGSDSSPTNPSPPSGNGSPVSIVANSSTLTTNAYAPNPINVSVGGSVTWTNNDNFTHSVRMTGSSEPPLFMKPGERVTRTFDTAGLFAYDCSLHPTNMTGTVLVQ